MLNPQRKFFSPMSLGELESSRSGGGRYYYIGSFYWIKDTCALAPSVTS